MTRIYNELKRYHDIAWSTNHPHEQDKNACRNVNKNLLIVQGLWSRWELFYSLFTQNMNL